MKRLSFALLTGTMLLMVALSADSAAPAKVPPPKNQAELEKMMRISWNQEVLPPGANPKTLERLLNRGEVALMSDRPAPGVPWMVGAGVMVNAAPNVMFNVVTHPEKFTEYVPMTNKATSTPVPGIPNLYEVTFGIELLFSWLSIEYSVYDYRRPPNRTDWCMASGEFAVNSGFYEIMPADGGKRAMAFYNVYAKPRMAAIQSMYNQEPALELMTNVATATMVVQAMRDQAEKEAGKKLAPIKEPASVEKILLEDPKTLRLLAEKGKILVLEPGPTVYVISGAVVNAPIETVFKVVTDFAKYPEFMPGVKESQIVGKGAKGPIVKQKVVIKLWEFTLDSSDQNEMELLPPDRIVWTIKRENGGPIQGFWRFIPLDNNTKTLMFNGQTQDIRNMGIVPRTALRLVPTLEYGLLAAEMTAAMDAFKKRIEKIAAAKPK